MANYSTLQQIQVLVGIFSLIQGFEYLYLQKPLQFIFRDDALGAINLLRITFGFLAIVVPASPWIWALCVLHVMTWLRIRGPFNGGSDYMAFIILVSLSVALAFKSFPTITTVCISIIAVQLVLSYFFAGIFKLKSQKWRNGTALSEILESKVWKHPPVILKLRQNEKLLRSFNWLILFFEIVFPVSLFFPSTTIFIVTVAILFHAANAYFFGLNRFLWVWMAGFPALIHVTN